MTASWEDEVTLQQAKAKLVILYQTLGIPQYFPFAGNIWDRITSAAIDEYRKVGDAAFATMMQDALAAIKVLATQEDAVR